MISTIRYVLCNKNYQNEIQPFIQRNRAFLSSSTNGANWFHPDFYKIDIILLHVVCWRINTILSYVCTNGKYLM